MKSALKIFFFFMSTASWSQGLDTLAFEQIGPNGLVLTSAFQNDEKILIAGKFSAFSGTVSGGIARLNSDGSLDSNFLADPGANGNVYSIAYQTDGKILIAGDFTSYNGTSKKHIARLNPDGSLDHTFDEGEGPASKVLSVAIAAEGKIFIGGSFESYNGITRNHIARLNSDGTLDSTFHPGLGVNDLVHTIAVQQDGKILVGGDFTNYNRNPSSRLIRLFPDGGQDTTFNIGEGANNSVRAIATQEDGKILIAGDFLLFDGKEINRIARLNSDGSLDNTFNIGLGPNNTIRNLTVEVDGKILVEGAFTSYNGFERAYIIKLNTDGSIDFDF